MLSEISSHFEIGSYLLYYVQIFPQPFIFGTYFLVELILFAASIFLLCLFNRFVIYLRKIIIMFEVAMAVLLHAMLVTFINE